MRLMAYVAAVVLAAGLAACQAVPRQRPLDIGPVNTGPGTLAEARKYLQGRWNLQSFDVFPEGQPPIHVSGSGSVTYDEYGNLEMEIHTDEASAIRLSRAGIPMANGVLSTKGRTAVDMQSRTLTYFIEGQPPLGAPSGPLALNRPRHWDVAGNILTLSTKADDGRTVSEGKWQKQTDTPK